MFICIVVANNGMSSNEYCHNIINSLDKHIIFNYISRHHCWCPHRIKEQLICISKSSTNPLDLCHGEKTMHKPQQTLTTQMRSKKPMYSLDAYCCDERNRTLLPFISYSQSLSLNNILIASHKQKILVLHHAHHTRK